MEVLSVCMSSCFSIVHISVVVIPITISIRLHSLRWLGHVVFASTDWCPLLCRVSSPNFYIRASTNSVRWICFTS